MIILTIAAKFRKLLWIMDCEFQLIKTLSTKIMSNCQTITSFLIEQCAGSRNNSGYHHHHHSLADWSTDTLSLSLVLVLSLSLTCNRIIRINGRLLWSKAIVLLLRLLLLFLRRHRRLGNLVLRIVSYYQKKSISGYWQG